MIFQYLRMSLKQFGLKLKILEVKMFSVAVRIDFLIQILKNSTIMLIVLYIQRKLTFYNEPLYQGTYLQDNGDYPLCLS